MGKKKLTENILTGVAGEYFVAGELSRRGYIASITLRNTKGVDILVTSVDTSHQIGIQVKTTKGKRRSWILNDKAEEYFGKNLFYVFVNLIGEGLKPDFYIVPSEVVARVVKREHSKWLETPGKKGQIHNNTSMRKFSDLEGKYLEKWGLLGLS